MWQWRLPARPLHCLDCARVPLNGPEKTLALNTFRKTDEQIPIRPQSVAEGCAHLPLDAIEILEEAVLGTDDSRGSRKSRRWQEAIANQKRGSGSRFTFITLFTK